MERPLRPKGHRHPKVGSGRRDSITYDPSTGIETGSPYAKGTRDSITEVDIFAVVDSTGYREDRFYTRSVNPDGHGEKFQLRVPQGLDSQMHAAVAEVPEYRTLQDLVRDAIVHRLEFLQKRYSLGDGARRLLELERIRADSDARAQEVEELGAAVEDMDRKLALCYAAEDWQMMAEELDKGSERADWLREPYHSKATKILEQWRGKARVQLAEMMRKADD